MANERHLQARVPATLAEAVESRAEAAGVAVADVLRAALVREVRRPVDRSSRVVVERFVAEHGANAEKGTV